MRLETEFFLENLVSFYHNSAGSSEWIASAIELPCAPYKSYFSNRLLGLVEAAKGARWSNQDPPWINTRLFLK